MDKKKNIIITESQLQRVKALLKESLLPDLQTTLDEKRKVMKITESQLKKIHEFANNNPVKTQFQGEFNKLHPPIKAEREEKFLGKRGLGAIDPAKYRENPLGREEKKESCPCQFKDNKEGEIKEDFHGITFTLLQFAQEIINFLKEILTNKSTNGLSSFFQKQGISRGELLSILSDLGIIVYVGNKVYKVSKDFKNNFQDKIKKAYKILKDKTSVKNNSMDQNVEDIEEQDVPNPSASPTHTTSSTPSITPSSTASAMPTPSVIPSVTPSPTTNVNINNTTSPPIKTENKELEETTGAASSGSFSAPLFSTPIKRNIKESVDISQYKDDKGKIKKIDKTETKYKDKSDSDTKKCLNCKYFNNSYCKIVKGDINKEGVCKLFTKKEIKEETGASSSGQYSQPSIWAKDEKNWKGDKKPIWPGGKIVNPYKTKPIMQTNLKEAITDVKQTGYGEGSTFVKLDKCAKLNNNGVALKGGCSQGAVDNVVKQVKKSSDPNIFNEAKDTRFRDDPDYFDVKEKEKQQDITDENKSKIGLYIINYFKVPVSNGRIDSSEGKITPKYLYDKVKKIFDENENIYNINDEISSLLNLKRKSGQINTQFGPKGDDDINKDLSKVVGGKLKQPKEDLEKLQKWCGQIDKFGGDLRSCAKHILSQEGIKNNELKRIASDYLSQNKQIKIESISENNINFINNNKEISNNSFIENYIRLIKQELNKLNSGEKILQAIDKNDMKFLDYIISNYKGGYPSEFTAQRIRDYWYDQK